MAKKHRLLSFSVFLLILCSLVLSTLPASAAAGNHTELLARASTIEEALSAAFLRRADELDALANEYITGTKTPTDENGSPIDAVEEAYRLRTLSDRLADIGTEGYFDSYALAIIENEYEQDYVGDYRSMESLADEMTMLFVASFHADLLDTPELVSDALTSAYMRAVGDKYASYFNEAEYAEYTIDSEAQYGGIGVTVTQLESGYVEVLSVTPDSPAQKADIRRGDIIVGVDGKDFVELGYSTAINMIRGKEGEAITISIRRGDETFEKTLIRAALIEYTVSYKMLSADNGKIGYIHISQFDKRTFEQFVDAVDALGKQGAEKFVFDVRNNLGGRLESVLAVLEYILPDSDLPLIRMEYKSETVEYRTVEEYLKDNLSESDVLQKYQRAKNHQIDSPIAVLCNGFTASAGELFTSCLRDHGVAKVIGEKTYGKGIGQTSSTLTDFFAYDRQNITYFREAVFSISTFYYSPPVSSNYEGVGITPDTEAFLSEEVASINFYKLTEDIDDQLRAATDYLKTVSGISYEPKEDGGDTDTYQIIFWVAFGILAAASAALCAFFIISLVKEKKKKEAFFSENDTKHDVR